MIADSPFFQALLPYQKRALSLIRGSFERFGGQSALRSACEYALSGSGKRMRPALVLMLADALGRGQNAEESALAIEFFHTASLIADDLPCMDDDDLRRGAPSLHKKFGESTALLASYALIAEGYGCLAKNARQLGRPELCLIALESAAKNTGALGATGGQFLDVEPLPLSEESLREVIEKKTNSLFELSFVFGWLFGGGKPSLLGAARRAANHYGLAFQIADDLSDEEQDRKNGRLVNMASFAGRERAREMAAQEAAGFKGCLKELGLEGPPLSLLCVSLDLH